MDCGAIAAGNCSVILAMYAYAMSDATASHIVLIPAIVVGLMYMLRQSIFATVETW